MNHLDEEIQARIETNSPPFDNLSDFKDMKKIIFQSYTAHPNFNLEKSFNKVAYRIIYFSLTTFIAGIIIGIIIGLLI